MSDTLQVIFSASGGFYAIPDVKRECGLWLSVEKKPLPVPAEWRRPGLAFACVMRGRDYWRIGHYAPHHTNGSKEVEPQDELVRDYSDASWWTPGLEEAWAEADGMHAAMETARTQIIDLSRKHVCEKSSSELVGQASLPANDARASAPPKKTRGERPWLKKNL
jgi:hypothetical protein